MAIVRVRPQQVAHGPLVRHFNLPIDRPDLIKSVQIRRKTAVQGKDLTLDNRSEWQQIEKISVVFPHVSIPIFAQALIVEAIDLRNLA